MPRFHLNSSSHGVGQLLPIQLHGPVTLPLLRLLGSPDLQPPLPLLVPHGGWRQDESLLGLLPRPVFQDLPVHTAQLDELALGPTIVA